MGSSATKVSVAPTLEIGASRSPKQACPAQAATSAPKPLVSTSSCTTKRREVRATDDDTASLSQGIRERRSITSTLTASFASCSAASNDFCTVAPQVTMVRSMPRRTVAALPMGIR